MISALGKSIYNTHLIVSRTQNDKPFKIRKNFDSLEEEKLSIIQRLEKFFREFSHIDIKDFFEAPYKVYEDSVYYELDFFTTPRAKKCYSSYIKLKELQDPDSVDSLNRLQESFKFVYKYCVENGIDFDQYQSYTVGTLPVFIDHLKNHHINFYTLHALNFQKIDVESDIVDFIFSEFFSTFQKTRNKYLTSKKMKEFAKQAKIKLTKKLKEQ